MRGHRDRMLGLGHVDRLLQQVRELRQPRPGHLHLVHVLAELLDGVEEVGEAQHEERDRPDRHEAVDRPEPTHTDHQRGGEDPGELDDGQEPARDPHRVHVLVVEAAVAPREPLDLGVLPAEGLDDPHPADALLQRGEREPDPVAHHQEGPVRVLLELVGGEGHEGQRDRTEQQELPRHDGEHDDRDHEEHDVREDQDHPLLDEVLHRVDVRRHARHDHAGGLTVVEGHREAQHVVEHPNPQIAQERFAHQAHRTDLGTLDPPSERRHQRVDRHEDVEGATVVVGDAAVDRHLDQERAAQDRQRVDRHEHDRRHDALAVRTQQRRELPGHPARVREGVALLLSGRVLDRRRLGRRPGAAASGVAHDGASPLVAIVAACCSSACAAASTAR